MSTKKRVELTNTVFPLDDGAVDSILTLMQLTSLDLAWGGIGQVFGVISHQLMKYIAAGFERHLCYQLVGQCRHSSFN